MRNKAVEWAARSAIRFPRTFWLVFRLREWGRKKWVEATPGDRAWRGAAIGLAVATIIFALDGLYHRAMLPHPTWDRVGGALGNVGEAGLYGLGIVLVASLIVRTPWRYRIALGLGGGVLASTFPFSMDEAGLVWGVLAFSAAGAGLGALTRPDRDALTPLQRRIAVSGVLAGTATAAYLAWFLFNPGFAPLEYRNAAVEAADEVGAVVGRIALPDPSTPGPMEVLYLTYGSGTDVRRNEFGRDADVVAATVDGRPMLNSWNDERKNFWGFDRDELPLQGRVWFPAGDGPFPLVLIVHGNHSMYEYSDPGYQYLGELLASRGIILASVDENFINGGIREENDARGWLLLEHLAQWQRWNAGIAAGEGEGEGEGGEPEPQDPEDNPFFGKVDMRRIGLIGHSRGGEAVAVAAAFNTLPYYPDDATVPFDYGFDLGAVIAIAPVMGQYRPGGRFTDVHDVNYFVIHGANDGDVSSFNGAGQYEHVWFSGAPYRFKSSLYVMGANHGQFNQVWGAWDSGAPFGRILSTKSLLPEADQRKVAEVYISAFLEATLRGAAGYLPLFADARAGADWLPETAYLVEFDDSRSRKVATFDEDVDVTTTTIAGGRTWAANLNVWREQSVAMKSRTKETAGVYLGWEFAEDAGEGGDGDEGAATGEGLDASERADASEGADAGEGSDASEGADAGEGSDASEGADAGEGAGSVEEADAGEGADTAEGVGPGQGAGAGDGVDVSDRADAREAASTPRYVIELPEEFSVDAAGTLFFSLADANESSAKPAHLRPSDDESNDNEQHDEPGGDDNDDTEADDEQGQNDDEQGDDEQDQDDEDRPREPVDFTVRLVDAEGVVAELPLSRFSMVQPQLQVQLRKAFLDEPSTESEAVFQSFLFPLRWFVDANPAFDAGRPARIEFVFNRSESGVVILDTIGFRPPAGS